jgi:hypothetical protein
MERRETSIEDAWCRWVKREYPNTKVRKWTGPNAPDRFVLCPLGQGFFIEFKRPGEEPREGQMIYLRWLESMGWTATWSDDLEDAKDQFRKFWRVRVLGEEADWTTTV